MLKRFLAVLTTVVLALGLSLGVTATVSANGVTCDELGYTKFDSEFGSQTLPWGTLNWSGKSLTYVLGSGWSVDLCIKSGSKAGTSTYQDVSGTGTLTISQGISHIGYKDPTRGNGLTCSAATLYKATPLANGDHINMDVRRNGGSILKVSASVDIAQSPPQDPASESGLVVRLTLDGSPVTLPVTNAQKAAGILTFDYSSGWTGSWTVEWVQFNSSYFNQNRDPAAFLHCQNRTEISVSTAPSATPPTCDADGALVIPTQANIIFTGGANGAGPGTYTISASAATGYVLTGQSTWTITVLAKSNGVNCERSVAPAITVAQCDLATGAPVSAFITIPSTTPHLIYSIGATSYAAGQKVNLSPGSYTVTVTAASGWRNSGPASYPITIAPLGCERSIEPTLTISECDATTGAVVGAFITIPSTTPHLTYSIGATSYAAGQKVNLSPGTYTVTVAATSGWKNTGPASYRITVSATGCDRAVEPGLTPGVCNPITGPESAYITIPTTTPHLIYSIDGTDYAPGAKVNLPEGEYTVDVRAEAGWRNNGPSSFDGEVDEIDCEGVAVVFTTPETCDPLSTDGESVDGSITIVHVAGVQFWIGTEADGSDKVPAGTSATTGNHIYPKVAGDYYVFAESVDSSVTLPHGQDLWRLTVDVPRPPCLPTQGLLQADARASGAVCSAFGPSQGAIVIEPTPGVSYAFKGGAAISANSTKVAPGTYTIIATADDGLSTLSTDEWVLTVAATTTVCDLTTLALTGQTPLALVALGFLLLQAGLVAIAMRFSRTRFTRRQVAG